jgi:peptidoglycan/xylan/chitin deacetylase (PgdA/CDA1 family)
VIITFGGGWSNNYTDAFHILQKYGFTATIFLTVAYIGTKKNYLDWDQVKEMRKKDFEFGSHTLTHPHLTKIPLEKARLEIEESKKQMESQLGEEVLSFCYLYGDYNQDIIKLVKEAGYMCAVVTPTSGRCESSIYTIRRVGLYSTDTMLSLLVKTSWVERVIAANKIIWTMAKSLKKWAKI